MIALLCLGCPGAGFAGTFVVFGPKDYQTDTGQPKTVTDTFSVRNPLETYTLLVYNGGLLKAFDRATSASVTLNGARIVGGTECNSKVSVVPRTVSLSATNRMQVVVQGLKSSGVTIKIIGADKDAPLVKPTLDPPPNDAGWNNTSVIVRFDCADARSGVATCPQPVTLSGEGTDQLVRGATSDRTDMTSGAKVKVNIDRTPPRIAATVEPPPNAAGWNRTEVTVRFEATDVLSGVATVSAPVTVSAEGAGQEIAGRALDRAGNVAVGRARVSIDRTPPSIRAVLTPAPNASGWVGGEVTVGFVCADGESGVAACSPPVVVTAEGADQEVVGRAEDRAGNVATAGAKVSVDRTPPTVTATLLPEPNADGWNRTDVRVTFAATDGLSGVEEVTPPVTVTQEGAGQRISGGATDRAGVSAGIAVGVNIAKRPPELSIASPASGSVTGSDQTTVVGSVTDIAPATVLVNRNPATVAGGRFMAQGVPLAEGLNTLSVTAMDAAGYSSAATVFVRREPSAPAAKVFAPPQIEAGGRMLLTADAIGPQAIVSISFYVDGDLVATDTARPFRETYALPPGGRQAGDVLVVVARALDAAGVESDDAVIVRVVAPGGASRGAHRGGGGS